MVNLAREWGPEYYSTRLHLSEITTSENKIWYDLSPWTITIDSKKIYRSVTHGNLNLRWSKTNIWISWSNAKNLRYFEKWEWDNLSHLLEFDNKPLTNFVRKYFQDNPNDIVESTGGEINNIIKLENEREAA